MELSYTPGFEGEPFDSVSLVGDFNEWDAEAAVMAEEVIGTWTTTVYLEPTPTASWSASSGPSMPMRWLRATRPPR